MKKIFTTACLLIIIDQVLKIWIKTNFYLGEEIKVFEWFIIHFTENNGMAFGFEFGGFHGKTILTISRIIIIFIAVKYLNGLITKTSPSGLLICLGLIIGGAIGNVIDSIFYGLIFEESYNNISSIFVDGGGYAPLLHGKVVDMFYFPIINCHLPLWLPFWGGEHFIFFRPVFNVADAGISIGVIAILLFYRRFF